MSSGKRIMSSQPPEIITISSSTEDSTDQGGSQGPSWGGYFPPLQHTGSSSRKDSTDQDEDNYDEEVPLTAKQLDKLAFDARPKVLGLPNKATCAEMGIKDWVAKPVNKEAVGKGKGKGKRTRSRK